MQGPIRESAVAGAWYPATTSRIAAEVEGYLAAASPASLPGALVALISPHAGLRYSGPVAAHGYSLLRGRRGLTVVLVGPSHRMAFDGVAVWAKGGFETPLGTVPIDEVLAHALLGVDSGVRDDPRPHVEEHSLEMQLPFLQHLVAELKIVPLLMGRQDRGDVDALAGALAKAMAGRDDVLLVASSDLSHYHPAPAANSLDALVVGDVERFDSEALMRRLEHAPEHACGGGPMVAVMKTALSLGARRSLILRYADSGDAGERDKGRVVGYLSAALYGGRG